MSNKTSTTWILIVTAALLVLVIQPGGITSTGENIDKIIHGITGGGGSYFGKQDYSGVQDKGVSFKVFGVKDGQIITELNKEFTQAPELFSTVEFNPPGNKYVDLDGIIVEHTIIADELNDVGVDINDLTGSHTLKDGSSGDSRYDDSLSGLGQSFTVNPGSPVVQQSSIISISDLTEVCDQAPYCIFKLQLSASFQDVDPETGQQITTNIPAEESYGTFFIKVTPDVCSDLTPFGQCSETSPGKFCDGINGLIDCANPTKCNSVKYGVVGCDCAPGYLETDGDGICTSVGCINGVIKPGECVGTDALVCDSSCAVEGGNCPAVQNCGLCGRSGQEAGAPLALPFDPVLNAAECPLAYNGDPAYQCSNTQYTCKYKGKKGTVSVSLLGG